MSKRFTPIGFVLLSLMVFGQSCSVSIGQPGSKEGGIYRSDDNGETWKQKSFVRTQKKQTVSISSVTTETIVIPETEDDLLYLGTRESGIWRSTNAGDRWESTSLRSGRYLCISISDTDPDELYTSSGTAILKSTDAGKTWKATYQEAQPANSIPCVIADPNQEGSVWAVTSGGKVLRSDDQAETWTLLQTIKRMTILKLSIESGDGRLIIFTSRGIFSVASDGSSWEDLTPNLQSKEMKGATDIRTVTVMPTGEWYLGTKFGPVVSSDGGESWEPIPTVIQPGTTPVTVIAVNPSDPSELFLVAGNRLHHTIDGGETWAVTNTPTKLQISQMMFDPNVAERLFLGTLIPAKK